MSVMRTLTVKQPYAQAIVLGHKTREYRSWATAHRDYLLIHAGKSRDSMGEAGDYPDIPPDAYVFGALVGCCRVEACYRYAGGWAWALVDAFEFDRPLPMSGNVGLWSVPLTEAVREALAAGGIELD